MNRSNRQIIFTFGLNSFSPATFGGRFDPRVRVPASGIAKQRRGMQPLNIRRNR